MEFLKTCNTNAQAIGDFEAIAYQAFSVQRDTANPSEKLRDRSPVEDLYAVEIEFRQNKHLVIQDGGKGWVWFFRPTTPDRAGQTPAAMPVLDGYVFRAEQSGVMKASELARPPLRNFSNPSTPSSASATTPNPFKGPLANNGRPGQIGSQSNQAPDQQPLHDSFAIYELFTASVVSLVSYFLVRDHNVIALNYRTFLSNVLDPTEASGGGRKRSAASLWLTSLSVYWTSSGTVVISSSAMPRYDMRRLDEVGGKEDRARLIGKCVRVAPSGILAKIVGFDSIPDPAAEDLDQRLQRKRLKVDATEQNIEKWKELVGRWLSRKGYSLDLDNKESWVKIRIAHSDKLSRVASNAALLNHSREVLWPVALCVYHAVDSGPQLASGSKPCLPEDALDWFETDDSTGFQDPLNLAQKWFLGKPDRDKAQEDRRKAKLHEQEATRQKEEHAGLYPSSPLAPRTGAYGDLQAASGVYPTPPDGVVAAPGAQTNGHPMVPATAATSDQVLVPGGNHPVINLSVPQDGAVNANDAGTSPEFQTHFDHFSMPGANDDLFEDMDEVLEGNGVTEDDFNFFDGPDGDEFDMSGNSEPQRGQNDLNKKAEIIRPLAHDAQAVQPQQSVSMNGTFGNVPLAESEPNHVNIEKADDTQKTVGDKLPARPKSGSPKQPERVVKTEPSPPLNHDTIQKKLMPSPEGGSESRTLERRRSSGRKESIFDPVTFNRKISLADAKYHGGRFSVPSEESSKPASPSKEPLKERANSRPFALPSKLRNAIDIASGNDTKLIDDDSDLTDSSDEVSSEDDEEEEVASIGPGSLSNGLILPGKRKFPLEGSVATPRSVTSFAESLAAESLDTSLQTDDSCVLWFDPTPYDWSLTHLPCPTEILVSTPQLDLPSFSPLGSLPNTPTSQPEQLMEPPEEKPVLSAKDTIAVAQIVTDQIVSATLDLFGDDRPSGGAPLDAVYLKEGWGRAASQTMLQSVVRTIFPKTSDCNAIGLASVQDVFPDPPQPSKGQQGQSKPAPRKMNAQADGTATPANLAYQISPPYIRVRRSDALWDLLPPALAFWEPLGLSPCSSPKNVVAFCVYPHSTALTPCLETFLVNVQLAYESTRLGHHSRMDTTPEFEGSLVPWKLSHRTSPQAACKALRDVSVQLGRVLGSRYSQLQEQEGDRNIDAFVIYMVDPFQTAASVWELCSAFWMLFQAYKQSPQPRGDFSPKPDLVLQIVPAKYIASFDAPIVLDLSTYISLAREVYDRCPPSSPSEDKTPLGIYSAPSFQLEESLPRNIPFKLVSEPPQDLLRENSYMHVGYAISLDGSWITAAWSDNCGKSQAVVSYHVGQRSFAEVAREIWQTTIEIIQSRRVTWRICVAKAGVMDREEFETWVFLTSCPTKLNFFVTLLTVDTTSNFRFMPTLSSGPTPNPAGTYLSVNTPGSTPQAGVSPEQPGLTPAATPSENAGDPSADPDSRLIDVTDETWGIILAHRLHNTNSTVEYRPALISGLLVKRGEDYSTSSSSFPTPDTERGPIVVGVNILWLGAVGSTRAATSPFPPSASADGVSPGGMAAQGPAERSTTSLMWTTTAQSRATVENLLKEVLGHFRALGLLARLKGMRGTKHGTVPWHVAAAMQGVKGISRCT